MKRANPVEFEHRLRDAATRSGGYAVPMIRIVMNRSDWIILIALALIWGAAFLFIGVAVNEVPPLTYVWARLTLAAAALWLFLRWQGKRLALPPRAWAAIAVLAMFNNVVPFILFGWGQTQIASGLASILNATTPIWGVLVAHLYTSDERMTLGKLAGVVIGFAGVAVMIAPDLDATGVGALPQLACLAAALCYAIAGVWARRFRVMGLPPATVASGQLIAGAVAMLPLTLAIDQPWRLPMPSLAAGGSIIALALVCTAYAYVLYFRLIDSAGATNALLVTLLVPPIAILLGGLVLGEILGPQHFAGLVLIAFGLAAIDGRLISRLRRTQPA